mmetsp:Transcript_8095/g.23218  ORF Transcript_8095/g.23218 Transcript_8095/m.23218 type:complete len:522 (+) Transcript_8095:195-1760(+)
MGAALTPMEPIPPPFPRGNVCAWSSSCFCRGLAVLHVATAVQGSNKPKYVRLGDLDCVLVKVVGLQVTLGCVLGIGKGVSKAVPMEVRHLGPPCVANDEARVVGPLRPHNYDRLHSVLHHPVGILDEHRQLEERQRLRQKVPVRHFAVHQVHQSEGGHGHHQAPSDDRPAVLEDGLLELLRHVYPFHEFGEAVCPHRLVGPPKMPLGVALVPVVRLEERRHAEDRVRGTDGPLVALLELEALKLEVGQVVCWCVVLQLLGELVFNGGLHVNILLAALGEGAAHLGKQQLEVPPPLLPPCLQPGGHVVGVQHGLVQRPVLHEGEAVVLHHADPPVERDTRCATFLPIHMVPHLCIPELQHLLPAPMEDCLVIMSGDELVNEVIREPNDRQPEGVVVLLVQLTAELVRHRGGREPAPGAPVIVLDAPPLPFLLLPTPIPPLGGSLGRHAVILCSPLLQGRLVLLLAVILIAVAVTVFIIFVSKVAGRWLIVFAHEHHHLPIVLVGVAGVHRAVGVDHQHPLVV